MYTPRAAVAQIADGVHAVLAEDPHALADLELLNSTELLLELRNQLDAVITGQLQVIDVRDVTVEEYGRQTRGWLIEDQLLAPAEASRFLTVARGLPYHHRIGEAFGAGRLSLEAARVITGAVQKAPAELREVVETELVTAAESVDPGRLGSFTRELIARLTNDDAEAAAQRKYDSRWLRLSETFEGMTSVEGMLDPASAASIKAALSPLLASTGPDDQRTHGQRTADALVTVAEVALAAGGLPETGGEPPQVIVTIGYDQLAAQIQAHPDACSDPISGTVSMNGVAITPNTARKIACDAQIIPAVLGGHSEVLDLGRSTRTWTRAQRRALRLEDRGCRWPGCQAPLHRCRIHHEQHWVQDHGPTDKTNGIHLCPFHHWTVHHTRWRIHKDIHNQVTVWKEEPGTQTHAA